MTTVAKRAKYSELIAPIKKRNKDIEEEIARIKEKIKDFSSEKDSSDFLKIKFEYIHLLLKQTFDYFLISRQSLDKLSLKNESMLNLARKNIYLILQLLEEWVGKDIDAAFSESTKRLKLFESSMTHLERFDLVRKIGILVDSLIDIYGENSKWRWSFVELEGRLVIIFKNLIDFPKLTKELSPSSENYGESMDLIETLMKKVEDVADAYRNKYEITSREFGDMKAGLGFLALRKRLALVMGDSEKASSIQKKIDIWNKKLLGDMEQMEDS